MNSTIYITQITEIGQGVADFLEQEMIILFKNNAPNDLAEYCVLHSENNLIEEIHVNDILYIGDNDYTITAVGSAVNQNLRNLGHITLRFNGAKESELPGTLSLEAKEINLPIIGDRIQIIRK